MKRFVFLLLVMMSLLASFSYAQSKESMGEQITDALAYPVLKLAWPTAIYDSCSFQKVRFNHKDNLEVYFKIYATSYWTGGSLWLETIVEINNDGIVDIRWGDYKAGLPPGSAATALRELSKK